MKTPVLVYSSRGVDRFAAFLADHGCEVVFPAHTSEEAKAILEREPIEVVFGFPAVDLAASKTVRWVQLMSAGVDYVVRQGPLPEHVTLTRMVGVFSRPMAEYVFAYLLYFEKDVERLRLQQHERTWQPHRAGVLWGKTIGVAGLGSIGLEIVRKARAFDMTVHGLSRTGANALQVDRHFAFDEWPAFVRDLDYLAMALPLTNETRHVINQDVLGSLKPGAILVNVGRGASVDEKALCAALKDGRLRAAVLDVFEQEPLQEDSELWALPNVCVTPHMSGPTTVETGGEYFLENLRRYEQGLPLSGVVNWTVGY